MGLIVRNKVFYGNQPNIEVLGGGGGYAPVGTVIAYMGTTAPLNYLACDGSVVNIADWPQLAHLFENQLGSANYFGGDGATTFAVPDLRGEFLRGTGNNAHADQGNGADVGVHQNATKITQALVSKEGNTYYIGGQNTYSSEGDSNPLTPYNNKRDADTFVKTSDNVWVSSTSHNTTTNLSYLTARPTNTSVLYCIKARSDEPFDPENVYSLNEQKVGYWIDGKPLYQKTVSHKLGTVSGTVTATLMSYDSNILVYDIQALIVRTNGSCTPIYDDYTASGTNYFQRISYGTENGLFVQTNITTSSNGTIYATIKYTKTTD